MDAAERQLLSDRFRLAAQGLTGEARKEFVEILRRAFSPSNTNRLLSTRAVELWIAPPSFSQKRNFIPRNAVEDDDFNARVFLATNFIAPISIPGGNELEVTGTSIEVRARRLRSICYESEAYAALQENVTGVVLTSSPSVDGGKPRFVFKTMNLSGVDTHPDTEEGEYDDPLPD